MFIQGKCSDSPSKKKRHSIGSLEKHHKITPKHNSLLFNLKKNIFYDSNQTPKGKHIDQHNLKTNKSFSNSVGKTTASSMKNLLRDSSIDKRSFSVTSDLKNKNSSKIHGLFS